MRVLVFCISCFASGAYAGVGSGLSFQGYTGLLNTPNAEVLPYGEWVFQYSDQIELGSRFEHGDNYIPAFGLFPNVEINGRIAAESAHTNLFQEPELRDLSANIKIRAPLIPKNWFSLAVGLQDIGGEVDAFDTQYIVASREFFEQFRLSAGIGRADGRATTGRLDGEFGGVEWTPWPWLTLLTEYDAAQVNTGIRLSTPKRWFKDRLFFDVTAQTSNSEEALGDGHFFSVAMRIPLGEPPVPVQSKRHTGEISQLNHTLPTAVTSVEERDASGVVWRSFRPRQPVSALPALPSAHVDEPLDKRMLAPMLQSLREKLVEHGFESVQIGLGAANQLYIAVENNIYNRNEVDALGVILGMASMTELGGLERLTLVLKNFDLPIIAVTGSLLDYRAYLEAECGLPSSCYAEQRIRAQLEVSYPKSKDLRKVEWLGETENSAYFVPRVVLSPVLNTGVATEVGVFDYSVALRTNVSTALWPGGQVSASWDTPLEESDDFEEGGLFFDSRVRSGLRNLFYHQTLRLHPQVLSQTSLGRFRDNFDAVLNDSIWQSYNGVHRIRTRLGRFEHRELDDDTRDVRLASYRYYWHRYDLSLEATYGEYFSNDDGLALVARHNFGDTSVSLFYANTFVEIAGVAISIPLSTRRDMTPGLFQLRGLERYTYGVQTVIREDSNFLVGNVADVPNPRHNLERSFYNNGRLDVRYIKRSLTRMRDAYLRYVE